MKSYLYHLQLNIDFANLEFYKQLLEFMGWQIIFEADHVALGTATIQDVDTVRTFLTDQGVAMLFDTPRHRPEYADGQDQTYYQIMFETPDSILFEVVYVGPKVE